MEIKGHKHILVCGDNRNSLGILRSRGEKGITPIAIIQNEGHIPMLPKSKYVGEIFCVDGFEQSLSKLMEYADAKCPPFVYLTDDNHLQLLDSHYDVLKNKFYFFNAGEQGRVTKYLSKKKQCWLAEQCGLRVPRYEEVKRGELPQTLHYPVITKTYNSYSAGWKRDVTICYTPDELIDAYNHMISERLLLQEYVLKKGECFLQGISINGGENVYIPFEAHYLNYSKTSFGWYSEYQPFHNLELYDKLKTFLQEIHFSGCFEIEFLQDHNDQLWFLEINMRFSGANYGVNVGGVNLPYLWAQSLVANKIITSDIQLCQDKYYVTNDINGISSIGRVKFRDWIRAFIHTDGYYVYNKHDRSPFYSWLWGRFKVFLKHKVLRKI